MKKSDILSNHLPELNILLLGETGVGKSTWINAFANFTHYERFTEAENKLLFAPIPYNFTEYDKNFNPLEVCVGAEDKSESGRPGHSQTQNCKEYEFPIGKTIIRLFDTPGMGSTCGVEQDRINFDNIIQTIKNYKEIHGICILLKPTVTRLSLTFRFCMKELFTHLNKSAVKNLIFCFTNSKTTNFKPGETVRTLRVLLKESNLCDIISSKTMYCFDSEPFKYLAVIENKIPINYSHKDRLGFCVSWINSMNETKRLLNYISNLTPHNVADTVCLYNARKYVLNKQNSFDEIGWSSINEYKMKLKETVDQIEKLRFLGHAVQNENCNELKKLKDDLMHSSGNLFVCYLKMQTILLQNDAKNTYLKQLLKEERAKVATGAGSSSIEYLETELKNCLYENKIFEGSFYAVVSTDEICPILKALGQM